MGGCSRQDDVEEGDHGRARAAALAGAVACLIVLCLPALARASTGAATIEGKVTEAGTGAPIAGIEVCAYPDNGEEEPTREQEEHVRCATTGASGEYVLKEVVPGPYFVGFEVPEGSSLNYVPQEYGGASPTPLVVIENEVRKEIDAQLAHGGLIAGVVTSATTGAGIEHAVVLAEEFENEKAVFANYTETGSGGAYTLAGLPAGSYKVVFLAAGYTPQAYKDSATLQGGELVAVEVLKTTGSIDAALTLSTALPGGGSPGGGPTGPSGATEPSTSGAPAPSARKHGAGSAAVPALTLSGRRFSVTRGGSALVSLRCSASTACSGRIKLTVEETVRIKGRERRKALTIALGPVLALAPGGRMTAHVELNARGRRLLRNRGEHLSVTLTLTAPGHVKHFPVELRR